MSEIGASGNAIRVTNQRGQRVYVTYVLRLFQGGPDKDGVEQTTYKSVTISAMGRAIPSAVNIAEIVKRRVGGLHQITSISSETVDASNKNDSHDDGNGKARKASVITIQLSLTPLKKCIGYQAPLPESMITQEEPREARPPRNNNTRGDAPRGGSGSARVEGRGGNRGGHDNRNQANDQPRRGGMNNGATRGNNSRNQGIDQPRRGGMNNGATRDGHDNRAYANDQPRRGGMNNGATRGGHDNRAYANDQPRRGGMNNGAARGGSTSNGGRGGARRAHEDTWRNGSGRGQRGAY